MDIKTGLAIYNQPWLIEPSAAVRMLDYWERVVGQNETWDFSRLRNEAADAPASVSSFEFLQKSVNPSVAVAPRDRYEMREFKGFEGAKVALFSITGPIMKNDFCGDYGTASLKTLVQQASKAKSIENIVFFLDSPGGSVDGTEVFADAIRSSTKNTIGIIGGLCCSACYWIGSSCKELYATAETDIIGSIGTMMSWRNYDKMMEANGVQQIEVYATRSSHKNKAFADADKGDSRALISEMLDPLNDVFLNAVQRNRSGKIDLKQEDVLTGKTYSGAKALEVGLIDGIKPAETILDNILSTSQKKQKTMSKSILAFGLVLAAAKATEFQVVEGGFMLSEEQLNNVDAHLDEQATLSATTAKALKTLQAQEEAFAANSTAVTDLATANEKIAMLTTDLETANAKITELEALPGATFTTTTADEDAPTGEAKKLNSFDQRAKDFLDA